jgi:hypothetical protein
VKVMASQVKSTGSRVLKSMASQVKWMASQVKSMASRVLKPVKQVSEAAVVLVSCWMVVPASNNHLEPIASRTVWPSCDHSRGLGRTSGCLE